MLEINKKIQKITRSRQILDEKKRRLLKEHNINLLEWKYTIEMTEQRVKKEINKITIDICLFILIF